MAKLSYLENRIIEQAFISQGWVLDFSDRTFHEFVGDCTGIDVNDAKYSDGNSGSKGNRLRAFIKLENDYTVGLLIEALSAYLKRLDAQKNKAVAENHYTDIEKIYTRLLSGGVVEHIDAIQANNDDKDFLQLAKLIKDSIQKNEPEAALDRLHTFMLKFLKQLCDTHGVEYTKEETVNAIYGKYIKAVRDKGFIESNMAEKIIQSTFQVIQAFNDIRNNKSFAHDNSVLNYDESVLIFGYVTSTVKFIQAIEAKNKNEAVAEAKPDWGDF